MMLWHPPQMLRKVDRLRSCALKGARFVASAFGRQGQRRGRLGESPLARAARLGFPKQQQTNLFGNCNVLVQSHTTAGRLGVDTPGLPAGPRAAL